MWWWSGGWLKNKPLQIMVYMLHSYAFVLQNECTSLYTATQKQYGKTCLLRASQVGGGGGMRKKKREGRNDQRRKLRVISTPVRTTYVTEHEQPTRRAIF